MALSVAAKAAIKAASQSKIVRNIIIFLVVVIFGLSISIALLIANYGAIFWRDNVACSDAKNTNVYKTVREFYTEYRDAKNAEIHGRADVIRRDNMAKRTIQVYNPSTQKMEEKEETYCKADIKVKEYQYLPTAYVLAYLNCKNKKDYLKEDITVTKEELFSFWDAVNYGVQVDYTGTEYRPHYDVYSDSMLFDDIAEELFSTEEEQDEYRQCVYFISQLIGDEGYTTQIIVARANKLEIPLFYQYSEPWGSKKYGNGTIAKSGCAPTCIAMIVSYFEGKNVYPDEIVAYTGNRYYVSGAGSSWSIFPACASNWYINCEQLPLHTQTIADKLSEGKPVILSMGAGTFTSAGHFIVLTGINEYGYVSVNDPNDNNKKNFRSKVFNLDQIIREAKGGWYFDR